MGAWCRFLLTWVIAVALPLQAVAHETLRLCGPGPDPVAGQHLPAAVPATAHHAAHHPAHHAAHRAADGGHAIALGASHGPAAGGRLHAPASDEAVDAAGRGGVSGDTTAVVPGAVCDGACAWCIVACGAACALPPTDRGAAGPVDPDEQWADLPPARVAVVGVDAPERPPRA